MAKWNRQQLLWFAFAACIAIGSLEPALALLGPEGLNPRDPRIRESAFLVVILWPIAAFYLVAIRANPVRFSPAGTIIRVVYSTGCALCLLHIAIAFHLGHSWSHRAAFNHTDEVGGYGWGVFVNYAFALLWVVDAIWMWVSLNEYLQRPAWANWLILGLMGFVIVNAAVVFGHGWQRWVALGFLATPGISLLLRRYFSVE